MNIKIDKADSVFSQYIRLRDGECLRCGSRVELNDAGMPISHQASHYFGRRRENTRFDPENVICLCHGCHQIWGSEDRESYREFMIGWLGEKGFKALTLRANQMKKKDRKMEYIKAKELLKSLGER